ncbi:hypothetical protein FACS1894147_03320 [Spirochaetia bacterium]|nr:hypothetical protein FACS1894147_03320 [Spirochaetia bacterium]
MSQTSKKIKTLIANNEDFEWYPTTDEILQKMNQDLHLLFDKGNLGNSYRRRREELFYVHSDWDRETKKDVYSYTVKSFLDVGAGDGRVFEALHGVNNDIEIRRRYGIEIAKAQADDLINRDIFIIGRDFFKTSLFDKQYSVIFSNPPYSHFVPWTEKLFREANFGVMYLVLPVRWKQSIDKRCGIELYDVKNIGEFDFLHADRTARARVNLIRITHKKVKVEDRQGSRVYGSHIEYGKEDEPDSFERWINETIGTFEAETEESEDERSLKLKQQEIPELVESFEAEAKALLDLFKSIGKIPGRVIKAFNIDRKSILEIIRENIRGLKNRYWKIAFDKLSAITTRLTHNTRHKLLSEMEEFNTLDFNEDNIYSIVIWVIKHFNEYTNEQILSVFDALTSQDYVKAYKSNVHWTQDNWRYAKEKGKPEKYQLDYRLVTHCYKSYRYDQNTVDDFIVICRSLGFNIPDYRTLDFEAIGDEQQFFATNGELAFTVRIYKNHNAHMKINQQLMMKFNIEVARLRHWINSYKDIQSEFDVSVVEAFKLWNTPNLRLLETRDIKLLGFDEKKSA